MEYVVHWFRPGVKIRLYFDSKSSEWIYLWDYGRDEATFIQNMLRPGDVFIDVGANIGLYTLAAARCVGPTGRVFSFEPCSETFRRLKGNIEINGFNNVNCFNTAISNSSTILEMNVSMDGFSGLNSLGKLSRSGKFATEWIQSNTWDDFVSNHDVAGNAIFMKIDVEGWEQRVLQGGEGFFSKPDAPTLQVEFEDLNAIAAGTSCKELYDELVGLGYAMYEYDHVNNTLAPSPLKDAYPNYKNLIATKSIEFINARLSETQGNALSNSR